MRFFFASRPVTSRIFFKIFSERERAHARGGGGVVTPWTIGREFDIGKNITETVSNFVPTTEPYRVRWSVATPLKSSKALSSKTSVRQVAFGITQYKLLISRAAVP